MSAPPLAPEHENEDEDDSLRSPENYAAYFHSAR